MFYVQRNAAGQLLRVEAAAFDQFTEMLPSDHADIQEWFADDVVENSLNQLKQSDLDMIRVLEDLIDVLTAKGVFKITDLPPARRPSCSTVPRRARRSAASIT